MSTDEQEAADAAAPPPRRAMAGRLVWVVAGGVAAILALLDQATKVIAVEMLSHRTVDLGWFDLNLVRNPNAAFGIPGFPGMFLLITVLVVILVVRMLRRTDRLTLAFALALVIGGALGNGLDRVLRAPGFPNGHVVDFVDLRWFPVFNLADSAITVGAILVVGILLRLDREEQEAEAAKQAHRSVRPDPSPPRR